MYFHLPLSCWAFPLDMPIGWRLKITAHLSVGFTSFHHSIITYYLLEPLSWDKQTEHLAFWDLKTLWCYINHAVLMMCTLCQLTIVDLLLIVYYLIMTTPLNHLHVRWTCKTTEWVFLFIVTFTCNPKVNYSLFGRDYPAIENWIRQMPHIGHWMPPHRQRGKDKSQESRAYNSSAFRYIIVEGTKSVFGKVINQVVTKDIWYF